MNTFRAAWLGGLVLVVAACSDGKKTEGTPDLALPFPAFAPSFPHAITLGGAILTSPKLVAVTFAGDPLATDAQKLVSQVPQSLWWKAVTAEYGVGPTTSLPPIAEEAAPQDFINYSFVQYQDWVASRFDGTHPEWGAPDPSAVYMVFLTTSLTACPTGGAWHDETQVTVGSTTVPIAFGIVLACDDTMYYPTALDDLTIAASHELVETVTDPHPNTAPAYVAVDDPFAEWATNVPVAELSDLCQDIEKPEWVQLDGSTYNVQKSWSNAAATAGQDPCVPATPGLVVVGAVPQLAEAVTLLNFPAHGVTIPVGGTKTIDVSLFSMAPTEGAWQVSASSVNSDNGSDELGFSFDKTTGENGDILKLTITVLRQDKNDPTERFFVTSTLGAQSYSWPGVVHN